MEDWSSSNVHQDFGAIPKQELWWPAGAVVAPDIIEVDERFAVKGTASLQN